MINSMAAGMGGLMAPQFETPKSKGGMFGGGKPDWASAISAALSGALAARGNPMGQIGLQMLQQRRQQALEEAQYQRRRGEGLEDYAQKQKIEAQYGRPQQPHYFEDNSGNLMVIGPDGQPKMVHKDPLQYKLVPNGLGGVVPVNIQQLMGGQGGQPPSTLSDDDWPAQGGPTPQASGGFPRPY